MRGHSPLISMRREGITPEVVFINDFPCSTSADWHQPGERYKTHMAPDYCTVSTAGDLLSSLDFRFVVGLKVVISASNELRARSLFAKAKSCGAKLVAACCVQEGVKPHQQTGWVDVYHAPVAVREVAYG